MGELEKSWLDAFSVFVSSKHITHIGGHCQHWVPVSTGYRCEGLCLLEEHQLLLISLSLERQELAGHGMELCQAFRGEAGSFSLCSPNSQCALCCLNQVAV